MGRLLEIQIRRGTASAWSSANPTLAAGEPGLESDTRQMKMGDGATAWNALPYMVANGLPAGITGAGVYDPQTNIYTPRGIRATKTKSKLAQVAARSGSAKIACVGDSTTAGWTGAASLRGTGQSWPEALAASLAALGYLTGEGSARLNDNTVTDQRYTYTGTWTNSGGANAGVYVATTAVSASIALTSLNKGDSAEAEFLSNLSGGTFTLLVDGVPPASGVTVTHGSYSAGTVTPDATNNVGRITVTGLTYGAHTIKLINLTTNGLIPVGMDVYPSNCVRIANFGSYGTTSGNWSDQSVFYSLINEVIAWAPDIAIVDLGVNDWGLGVSTATMQTNITAAVALLQAAGIEVILQTPAPFIYTGTPTTAFWQVFYTVADAKGCLLLDVHDRWETEAIAAANNMMGTDTAHNSATGMQDKAQSALTLIEVGPAKTPVKNNYAAVTDPTVTDDLTKGYTQGSKWTNTATGWEFSALSVGSGVAIWMRISPTSLVPAVVPQAGASNILLPFTSVATAAVQTGTGVLNLGQFMPFIITKPTAISALAFNVTVIVSGGTAVAGRLALFNDNGAGGPGTLIADYGTTTFASTGIRSISGARTLQPGIYWGAYKYEYTVAPTTHPTLTSMNQVIPLAGPSMTSINYRCLQSTGTISGAFTSNPTATPNAAQAPIVGLVIA